MENRCLGVGILVFGLLGSWGWAMAQNGPPMGGPPPEAFTACETKQVGDACSHPTPMGSVSGDCQTRGARLQCIPVRSPVGGGGGGGLTEQGEERVPHQPRYSFASAPVPVLRQGAHPFTLPNGHIHWYEAVHTPQGGINWLQAKYLAEEAGGYLATLHSRQENDFVFSLIKDEKFWFQWNMSHNYVMNGPFLGGFQPAGSPEPRGGWRWVTGEPWEYENWAWDGMPGDDDPRPSTQPNDATGNQDVVAFGEVNRPVPTWGDFPYRFSSHGSRHEGKAFGFVIEYNQPPQ